MQRNNYLLLAEEVGICDDGCIAQGVYFWFCENGNGMEGFALHYWCIGRDSDTTGGVVILHE